MLAGGFPTHDTPSPPPVLLLSYRFPQYRDLFLWQLTWHWSFIQPRPEPGGQVQSEARRGLVSRHLNRAI